MTANQPATWATAPFPAGGLVRVSKDPLWLPSGPWGPGTGPNRFDDPLGRYGVRYGAETLEGCLKEVMSRFRSNADFEQQLADVTGLASGEASLPPEQLDDELDDDLEAVPAPPGPDHGPNDGLREWLAEQRFATFSQDAPPAVFVDAYDNDLLAELNRHERVRAVLDTEAARELLGEDGRPPRLDQASVRQHDSRVGRPLTQAVSRVVYEHPASYGGLAYRSRVDDRHWCWAVYERTPLLSDGDQPLDPELPSVREALISTAQYLDIVLPDGWAELSAAG